MIIISMAKISKKIGVLYTVFNGVHTQIFLNILWGIIAKNKKLIIEEWLLSLGTLI